MICAHIEFEDEKAFCIVSNGDLLVGQNTISVDEFTGMGGLILAYLPSTVFNEKHADWFYPNVALLKEIRLAQKEIRELEADSPQVI